MRRCRRRSTPKFKGAGDLAVRQRGVIGIGAGRFRLGRQDILGRVAVRGVVHKGRGGGVDGDLLAAGDADVETQSLAGVGSGVEVVDEDGLGCGGCIVGAGAEVKAVGGCVDGVQYCGAVARETGDEAETVEVIIGMGYG